MDLLSDNLPILFFPVRLETKFSENLQLCVRIYPDQLTIHTHNPQLTQEEVDASLAFKSTNDPKAAWRVLVHRYGSPRAAWIVKNIDRYTDGNEPFATGTWNETPTVDLLPDYFIVRVYEEGNLNLICEERGNNIPQPLPLLWTSWGQGNDGGESSDDEPKLAARWINEFDQAKKVGMAVEINLGGIPANSLPSKLRVIAIGIRDGSHPNMARQDIQAWVDNHHYTRGFAFLPYGSPTNNTQEVKAGFSETADDPDRSFEDEFIQDGDSPQLGPEPVTNAEWLRFAFGLSAPANNPDDFLQLKGIRGAVDALDPYSEPLQTTLWPVTGDYFLRYMLAQTPSNESRLLLWQHFRKFVRARGPLPCIRIGNLPYGILPVAPIRSEQNATFLSVINQLMGPWLTMAMDDKMVPRIGIETEDPDKDLLGVLGMEPGSVSWKTRPYVDERFVCLLMVLLREWVFSDVPSGIRNWILNWRFLTNQNIELLHRIFPFIEDRQPPPPLYRAFAWGDGTNLTLPMVVDPTNTRDVPKYYLEALWRKGASAPPNGSNTLLYDLIRRSLILEDDLIGDGPSEVQAALERLMGFHAVWFLNHVGELGEIVKGIKDDPSYGPPRRRAYGIRPSLAKRILKKRDSLSGKYFSSLDQIDQIWGVGPDTLHDIVVSRQAPNFPEEVEAHLRDVFDLCTHRLDAWATSLATKQLIELRDKNSSSGIHIGAYGWVEELQVPVGDAPAPRIGKPLPVGGFIHAPSLHQAETAAVLRNAFLTHGGSSVENPFCLNLNSERVRLGLSLLDGVRQGQDLSQLLGYRFEHALHENGLDKYIDDFRAGFPISNNATTSSGGGSDGSDSQPRNVVDGLDLKEAWRLRKQGGSSFGSDDQVEKLNNIFAAVGIQTIIGRLEGCLDTLCDAVDATSDLLIAEGIFQACKGNFERSGAALDANAGHGSPPEIEFVKTPVTKTSLKHRLCVLLPDNEQPQVENCGPKELAEPSLSGWFGSILGAMEHIGCRVYYPLSDGSEDHCDVGLDKLGISPLDFLYLSAYLPEGGETNLERLVAYYVRGNLNLSPDTIVRVDPRKPEDGFGAGIDEAVELARRFLSLFSGRKYICPKTLRWPEESGDGGFSKTDCELIRDRVKEILQYLIDFTFPNPGALIIASRFGIEGVIPSSPQADDEELLRKKAIAKDQLTEKTGKVLPLLNQADGYYENQKYDQAVPLYVEAIKSVFGDSFIMLPPFDQDLESAHFQQMLDPRMQENLVGDEPEDRVMLWLQQVAQTNSAACQLEDALMVGTVWRAVRDGQLGIQPVALDLGITTKLCIAQLPVEGDEDPPRPWRQRWMALSDEELCAGLTQDQVTAAQAEWSVGERPRGKLSMVALLNGDLEPTTDSHTNIAGLLLEDWDEYIPAGRSTTGVSFQYLQPNAQAPQCLLLALPRENSTNVYTAEDMAEILLDTMKLMKARLVDTDAFTDLDADKKVGNIFPSLFLPVDPSHPGWNRTISNIPSIEEWENILKNL